MIKLVFIACCLLVALPGLGQDLLLESVALIDPQHATMKQGHLLIKEGKILGLVQRKPSNFEGQRIDLSGKYVVPAFADMHTHSFGNMGPGFQGDYFMTAGTAWRMLYCGNRAFLDLFSEENSILAIRDLQRQDPEEVPGAEIFCAGPILTCDGGHGTEYGIPTRTVNSPEEARTTVNRLAEKRPDVIKLVYDHAPNRMPSMDRATMEAVIEAASLAEIPAVVHIGTWEDIREVVLAGAKAVTHIPTTKAPVEVLSLMKEKGAVIIPTLSVQLDFQRLISSPEVFDHPLLQAVAGPALTKAYLQDEASLDPRSRAWLAFQRQTLPTVLESIKDIYEAGIPILTGTDAGNLGTFQGYSIHREMLWLQEAGIPAWEILKAATVHAGAFLGRSWGCQQGDDASLVILGANPLEDIRHTQEIDGVVYQGEWVDRNEWAGKGAKARTPKWASPLLDDFDAPDARNWEPMTDRIQGGSSIMTPVISGGTLQLSGRLETTPQRPYAWASLVGSLEGEQAFDISSFEGLRIKCRSLKGPLMLKLHDAAITNFDYHAASVPAHAEWEVFDIPFTQFRQTFSAQVPWTGKQIQAISFDVQSGESLDFSFEIDHISFY